MRGEAGAPRPRRTVLLLGAAAAAALAGCTREDPAPNVATGDGQLEAALSSARSGDTVTLDATATGYTVAAGLTVPAGVHLVGRGAVLRPARRMPFLLLLDGDATVEDVRFEAGDLVSRSVIQVTDRARGASIRGCVVDGGGGTRLGIEVGGSTRDVGIESTTIRNVGTGLSVAQGFRDVRISDVSVAGWSQRGIYVLSRDTRSSGLTIESCRVSDLRPGGSSRYPISVTGTEENKIEDVTIRDCVVHGPGRSWIDGSDPGTADQIAVRHVRTVLVSGNESTGGGDMGMTIAHCSGATVEHNTCRDNDSAGIWVGTRPGFTMGHVEVVDNTVTDNGRNRTGQRPGDTSAGIRLVNAAEVVVTGNVVGNTDAARTERHGVSVKASPRTEIRDNTARGLDGRIVYDSALGTDVQAD